jgi:precorrin-2 dehydrogenase/sirohydrochlorin ferrochelatase
LGENVSRTEADRNIPYYPAFLDLCRKRVVVVGGGAIATGKVRGLIPCGAEPLVVIAPVASGEIRDAAAAGRVEWLAREYRDGDLEGADVAFAATDDRALNATVAREARRRGVPVLAVDDVPNCDFIAPAIVRRGDLVVAISTGGHSPAFARRVREHLDADLPAHWGDLLKVVGSARERLGPARARVTPRQWLAAIDDELEDLVRQGELSDAEQLLLDRLLLAAPAVAATAAAAAAGAAAAALGEAVRAVDRLAAGRAEGDLGLAAARGADGGEHLAAVTAATTLGAPLGLARRAAIRAAAGLVGVAPLGVEILLALGEHELLATFATGKGLIGHRALTPSPRAWDGSSALEDEPVC